VAAAELLARFILRRQHVRADGTLKPDPFMPYKWVELSVTRHLGLDEPQIWLAGQTVANETDRTQQGRADATAQVYVRQRLRVLPKPLPSNLNHADVVDWPAEEPAQREIALMIARRASYKPRPEV
jgi:hypothetical protein